jgi:hypothetical protein
MNREGKRGGHFCSFGPPNHIATHARQLFWDMFDHGFQRAEPERAILSAEHSNDVQDARSAGVAKIIVLNP